MRVEAAVDTAAAVKGLQRLAAATRDTKPALRSMGAALVERSRLTFRDQADPWGGAWAPLSQVTLERRAARRSGGSIHTKKGKVKKGAARIMATAQALLDTGRLRNSITFKVEGGGVTVGTNVIYAGTQQYGAAKRAYKGVAPWGDVPARAFLPSRKRNTLDLPRAWAAELLDIVAKHLLLKVQS